MSVVVAISGSSGVILGVRLLELLRGMNLPTHLVVSDTARKVMVAETAYRLDDVERLATQVHRNDDLLAPIASGSFKIKAMAVVPCSMKTLSGIANGYSQNLIQRAADVCLKERRRLVLAVRETPLNLIHIDNMRQATLAGAIILPPVITMYSKPQTIEAMVDHILGKILDSMGIENSVYRRWEGAE